MWIFKVTKKGKLHFSSVQFESSGVSFSCLWVWLYILDDVGQSWERVCSLDVCVCVCLYVCVHVCVINTSASVKTFSKSWGPIRLMLKLCVTGSSRWELRMAMLHLYTMPVYITGELPQHSHQVLICSWVKWSTGVPSQNSFIIIIIIIVVSSALRQTCSVSHAF